MRTITIVRASLSLAAAVALVLGVQRDCTILGNAADEVSVAPNAPACASSQDFEASGLELASFMLFTKPSPWTLPHWSSPAGESFMTNPHRFHRPDPRHLRRFQYL
ncbi:MAG: hypothetical protein KF724_09955 [Phycisphaeraceae bacterium]|nr:hypothetical protein [Phycisphaeraceae bacterium]